MAEHNVSVKITVPNWIEEIIVWPVLMYRKWKYGYAFRKIALNQGYYAIVDPEDYPMLIKYKWHKVLSRGVMYAETAKNVKLGLLKRKMHREIMRSIISDIRHETLDIRKDEIEVKSKKAKGKNNRFLDCARNDESNTKSEYLNTKQIQNPNDVRSQTTEILRYAQNDKSKSKPEILVVDHINHNGLDNRKANLRVVTVRQNAWNRRFGNNCTSKFTGVSWKKSRAKWQARINIDGVERFLGYFDKEEEAARAFDAAAFKHRGEYACLNFPEKVKH